MAKEEEGLNTALRHGAYVCFEIHDTAQIALAAPALAALAQRLGLGNEFEPGDGHPQEAIAFLRRIHSEPGDLADEALLRTDAIVHVASSSEASIDEFCAK